MSSNHVMHGSDLQVNGNNGLPDRSTSTLSLVVSHLTKLSPLLAAAAEEEASGAASSE
jgi:hypothetical protein